MVHVSYTDPNNKLRVWETLERTNHSLAEVDAVEVIPILKRKGEPNQLVLIRQFRPPVGGYVIELPAGLTDASESTEVCALRELKEETGYVGTVVARSPKLFFGQAVSSTCVAVVTVVIDGDLPENRAPRLELEDGEFTEVLTVPTASLTDSLDLFLSQGDLIDGKLYLLGLPLQMADLFLSSSL